MNSVKVLNQDAVNQYALTHVNQDANVMMDISVVTMDSVSIQRNVSPMNNVHLANITISVPIFATNFIAAQILDVVFHLKKSAINL